MSYEERINEKLSAIRNRREISENCIGVKKLLNIYNMGMWADVCCSRIASENLIDGEHVMIDFLDPGGILLDDVGISACSSVLSGYIDTEAVKNTERYLEAHNGLIRSINDELKLLREYNKSDIKKFLKSGNRYLDKYPNESEEIIILLRAELKARSVFNRLRVRMSNCIDSAIFRIKNRHILRIIKNCAIEIAEGL